MTSGHSKGDGGDTDRGRYGEVGPIVLAPDEIDAGTDPLGVGVGAGDAPPGTYALVFDVDPATTIAVGALGTAEFPSGAYAYVGSAFGSNGLGRVDRHRRVADGSHGVTHWHVDYLGGHPNTSLASVVAAPYADIECRLASELRERVGGPGPDRLPAPAAGFGASDCGCPAHLVGGDDPAAVRTAAVEAVRGF